MTPTPRVFKPVVVVPAANGAPVTSLKAGLPEVTLVVYASTAPAILLEPEATPESATKRYWPLASKTICAGEPPGAVGRVMTAVPVRAVKTGVAVGEKE